MTPIAALEGIKTRAAGLTKLCPDYMARGIRHLERNCDLGCPAHQDDDVANCQTPKRGDGERLAKALADLPKLAGALEAVLATADGLDFQARVLNEKADAMTDPQSIHRARSRADAYTRIAGDLRRNITDALS